MDARKMDRPIIIQQLVNPRAKDAAGGPIESWTTFWETLAEIVPVGGLEYFAAQQVNAEFTSKFRVRYRSGIDSTMRILYNGSYYEIISKPTELGRRERLEIKARIRSAA